MRDRKTPLVNTSIDSGPRVMTLLGAQARIPALGIALILLVLFVLMGKAAWGSPETADTLTQSALHLDAHPARGAVIFKQHCASCHGADGDGDANRKIPALASQRFAYLVRQLANFASAERDSDAMHSKALQRPMNNPQTWVDIAAHLNKLPTIPAAATGVGTHVALGRGIFHEQCASCHQDDARGDDDGFVPSLRNQHFPYLVDQLHRIGEGERHNADEDLMRFVRSFDDNDIRAVADYLSRLRGPGRDRKAMRDDGVVVD